MKAAVTDHEALASLRTLDFVAYLRSAGWTALAVNDANPFTEWAKDTSRGHFEIQVPRHPLWKDYARRMGEALATLADEERRSQLELINDIPMVARDVIRVRSVVPMRSDGSIPLDDGAQIALAARNMMLAAACATVEARRAWGPRKPQKAMTYLDEVSLGQTERGSFVLTLHAPIPPSLTPPEPGELAQEDEPFNRRVTRMLATALGAIKTAAELGVTRGDLSAFEAGIEHGISADLCESLALVRDCATVALLEVKIGWASARRPISPPATLHQLAPDALDVIREAGRVLRERTPVEDFELEGLVVKVDRPGDERFGAAVILTSIEGRNRQVHIGVSGDDWDETMQALKDRSILRCRGELVRQGKRYSLQNIRALRIVKPDE